MTHCVNIDWLECYCIEPSEGRSYDYYTSLGLWCKLRDYGTRHFEEVFTIYDQHGDPFIEVRRKPRSASGKHAIYPDGACNLRFVNRYCYFDQCTRIMAEFIYRYRYEFRRIFRLDLCMDFERFDSGDYPHKVVRRILNHSYAKVYQAKRTTRGNDRWDGCEDNYLRWGNEKSMVVTRLYNKSLELQESGWKKPWIVQAWLEHGLIENPVTRCKTTPKGKTYEPTIWRLEFQINSSARKYLRIDSDDGDEWVEHTLETYETREQIEFAIANLCRHYFRFKIFEKGKRKYNCKDKVLFEFDEEGEHYKLMNTAIKREYSSQAGTIIKQLERIRMKINAPEELKAIDVVIRYFAAREMDDFTYRGISPKILQILATMSPETMSVEKAKQIQAEIFV